MIFYENLAKVNQEFFHEYKQQFNQVLESGWYILGKEVLSFEEQFAKYLGAKYCIGVANGLDALRLSLLALELPKNSEVILSANSYIAAVLAVFQAGLKPILVDIEQNSPNINPDLIIAKITDKTKVILPTHMYGIPADLVKLKQIANQHDLVILEDSAQAHGAEYNNIKIGNTNDLAAFSFYPTKNLGALGDGGAISTNNYDYYQKLLALRNYGSHKKYHNNYLGYNSRLDEMQASFLKIKLANLDKINNHKANLAKIYKANLDPSFKIYHHTNNIKSAWHIFSIMHENRDQIRDNLLANNIQTEIHYPIAPYRQPACLEYFSQDTIEYPVSDAWHNTTLSLPLSYANTEQDIKTVCDTLNKYITINNQKTLKLHEKVI